MSLSVFNPLPDPTKKLRDLERENERLRRELADARQDVLNERQAWIGTAEGVQNLRTALEPLYTALRKVFGAIDATGFESMASTPRHSAVWESWKHKLGGQTAEAIDVLALHGEMNAEQLRIHLRCARTHVYNVISKLNKAGIIDKNGGRISLKEL